MDEMDTQPMEEEGRPEEPTEAIEPDEDDLVGMHSKEVEEQPLKILERLNLVKALAPGESALWFEGKP